MLLYNTLWQISSIYFIKKFFKQRFSEVMIITNKYFFKFYNNVCNC